MSKTTTLSIGMDKNGNKILKYKTQAGGFSVQTNGNLPKTERDGITFGTVDELRDYINKYGTKRQKTLIAQV